MCAALARPDGSALEVCGQAVETVVVELPDAPDDAACDELRAALAHERAVLMLVADMSGDYLAALARLATLPRLPPHVPIEVLLHKADRIPRPEARRVLQTIGRQFQRDAGAAPYSESAGSSRAESTEDAFANIGNGDDRKSPLGCAAQAQNDLFGPETAAAPEQWSPDNLSGQETHFQLASTHDRSLLLAVGNILQRHAAAAPALEALADRLCLASPTARRVLVADRQTAVALAVDTLPYMAPPGDAHDARHSTKLHSIAMRSGHGYAAHCTAALPALDNAAVCNAASEAMDLVHDLALVYGCSSTCRLSASLTFSADAAANSSASSPAATPRVSVEQPGEPPACDDAAAAKTFVMTCDALGPELMAVGLHEQHPSATPGSLYSETVALALASTIAQIESSLSRSLVSSSPDDD